MKGQQDFLLSLFSSDVFSAIFHIHTLIVISMFIDPKGFFFSWLLVHHHVFFCNSHFGKDSSSYSNGMSYRKLDLVCVERQIRIVDFCHCGFGRCCSCHCCRSWSHYSHWNFADPLFEQNILFCWCFRLIAPILAHSSSSSNSVSISLILIMPAFALSLSLLLTVVSYAWAMSTRALR